MASPSKLQIEDLLSRLEDLRGPDDGAKSYRLFAAWHLL